MFFLQSSILHGDSFIQLIYTRIRMLVNIYAIIVTKMRNKNNKTVNIFNNNNTFMNKQKKTAFGDKFKHNKTWSLNILSNILWQNQIKDTCFMTHVIKFHKTRFHSTWCSSRLEVTVKACKCFHFNFLNGKYFLRNINNSS